MPHLEWAHKEKVVNHHLDVPYRILEKSYDYGEAAGNVIVHGDNLAALKSLLPEFGGRISCIYIDPPYNTGNEGWIYNDNVNDPALRRWLGAVVGKDGEDLSRHDKWLSMMYPRLKLLRELLADDGAIFISIDDNEQANLKLLCDEIFGAGNFVANIAWQRTYSTRNDSKGIVNEVEHILAYSKQPNWQPNKLPRTAEMDRKYKNPDGDKSAWTSDNPFAPGAATHQGMVYAIEHAFTGELIYPSVSACWRYQQDEMLRIMQGWCGYELRILDDAARRAAVCGVATEAVRANVAAIVLSEPLAASRRRAKEVYKKGPWPKFYFTKGGLGGIRRKTYLDEVGGVPPTNLFSYEDAGHTDEAKKALLAILGSKKATFDTPKPTRLVERILQIATKKDAIVLDSFAGSGTTAHAVLKQNRADGGRRRFVLVELMDYAETITAERVRRVMAGYGAGEKAVEGTGGGFSFYELGEPILIGDKLNEDAPLEAIRRYIYYTETRMPCTPQAEPYLLGVKGDTAYYFLYEKERETTLGAKTFGTLKTEAESYVIYADLCTLSPEELARHRIRFKKIPRDIVRV